MSAVSLALAVGLTVGAPVIRYATATSHLGAYDQSGRYGAPLLFDGDDRTAWCEGAPGPGRGERVGIELTRPIRADRIRVAAGEPWEFGRFLPANRPRVLTLTNLRYTWQIYLPDAGEPFEMALPPPITGRQLTIRIDEVHDHRARHTCIAEITLFEGKTPLVLVPNAPETSLGRFAPSVEGPWTPKGEKEPESFLVFHRDGAYRWLLHPNWSEDALDRTHGSWRLAPAPDGLRLSFAPLPPQENRAGTAHFDVEADGRPTLVLDGPYAGVYTPWVPDAN